MKRAVVLINIRETVGFMFCFTMWFFFITPEYVTYNSVFFSRLLGYGHYASIIVIFALFLLNAKNNVKRLKSSFGPLLLLLLFEGSYFLITFFWGGNYVSILHHTLKSLGMCLLVFDILTSNNIGKLKGAVVYFECLLYITLLLQIMFPKGLYNFHLTTNRIYCFLGHQNTVLRKLYIGVIFSVVYSFVKFRYISFRTWLFVISLFFVNVLQGSSTAMVAMGITLICLVLFHKGSSKLSIWTYKRAFFASLVLFILVVFMRNIQFYSNFVENILQKSMTFSGRTYAWDRAIYAISKRPLFGYGYQDNQLGYFFWLSDNGNRSCHNFYLDILYRTGFWGMLLIVVLIILSVKMADINNTRAINKTLIILSMAFFIPCNFEPYVDNELCYALVPIIMNSFIFSEYSICCYTENRNKT